MRELQSQTHRGAAGQAAKLSKALTAPNTGWSFREPPRSLWKIDREIIVPIGGGTIDVPVGSAHRVKNSGNETLIFIEVQRGSYLGEDDIVRLQDDFGRAG